MFSRLHQRATKQLYGLTNAMKTSNSWMTLENRNSNYEPEICRYSSLMLIRSICCLFQAASNWTLVPRTQVAYDSITTRASEQQPVNLVMNMKRFIIASLLAKLPLQLLTRTSSTFYHRLVCLCKQLSHQNRALKVTRTPCSVSESWEKGFSYVSETITNTH